METQQSGTDGMVTVTAKEDCALLIDGKSVELKKGESVEMPADAAKEYAALGYVEVGKAPTRSMGETSTSIGESGTELGAPKVPRKPV